MPTERLLMRQIREILRLRWACGLLSFAKTQSGGPNCPFSSDQETIPVHDKHPAPPASTLPVPLRRPPPARSREPGPAPAARRVQAEGDPTEPAAERSALLGLVVEGVDRVEERSGERGARHRPAVAAAPLPRALGHALRAAHRRPPARPRRTPRP